MTTTAHAAGEKAAASSGSAGRTPRGRRNSGSSLALSKAMRALRVVITLVGSAPVVSPSLTCDIDLPMEYFSLMNETLVALESHFQTEIVDGLNMIGLPLVPGLGLSDVLDLKSTVFDGLFGSEDDRTTWLNSATSAVDVRQTVLTNAASELAGSLGATIDVGCSHNAELQRYSMDIVVDGSVAGLALDDDSLAASILPESLGQASISSPVFDITYGAQIPMHLDLAAKKFDLGDVAADLSVKLSAELEVSALPILEGQGSLTLTGSGSMAGTFTYSRIKGWSSTGSLDAALEATTVAEGTTSLANIGLRARDNEIFDATPPKVAFNFDVCDFVDGLKNSISSLEVTADDIEAVMDTHLDLSSHPYFSASLTEAISDAIASEAQTQVNTAKQAVLAELDSLAVSCTSERRLGEVAEVSSDGSQRKLSVDLTFDALVEQLTLLDIISSVSAGLFPSTMELRIDLGVHKEVMFGSEDLQAALEKVFERLDVGLFAAGGNMPNIAGILSQATVFASFDFELSAGFSLNPVDGGTRRRLLWGSKRSRKQRSLSASRRGLLLPLVDPDANLKDFFVNGALSTALSGALFLSVNKMSLRAQAKVTNLNVELFSAASSFPAVSVQDGHLDMHAGIQLSQPFKFELNTEGGLAANLIGVSNSIKSAFQFTTDGQLSAMLPIAVDLDGTAHEFKILFTDEDSFDAVDFSVLLDFDACKVSSVLRSLMSHIGSSYLSPSDILGPMSTMSGIDFFSDAQGFDGLFPNFEKVLGGVVEAKNELFHLCQEVQRTGVVAPTLDDVVSLVIENVISSVQLTGPAGMSSRRHRRGRRALRASHLPYTHYTRPRQLTSRPAGHRRRLQDNDQILPILDSLEITGGYDGSKIFLRLGIDVSMGGTSSIDAIIQKPLDKLQDSALLRQLFPDLSLSTGSALTLDVQTSHDAGAHLTITVGCDLTSNDIKQALLGNPSFDLGQKGFLQFEAVSAKAEGSAQMSGSLDFGSGIMLETTNSSAAIAFGLGMVKSSPRIYFSNLTSTAVAIRNLEWQHLCALDMSVPVMFDGSIAGEELQGLMSNYADLEMIINIQTDDLCGTSAPSISIDADLNQIKAVLESLLAALTDALGNTDSVPPFDVGPFGNFATILDKFDIGFSGLLDEYIELFDAFAVGFEGIDASLRDHKPPKMARFPSLHELGSRFPSPQLSLELKGLIWDRLVTAFPAPTFNGVQIPGLQRGLSFEDTYVTRGDFPLEKFLPHVAVAFGYAVNLDDFAALNFNANKLFEPNFGAPLSTLLLNKLKAVPALGNFTRFDGFDLVGIPMDSMTFEVFRVEKYLPHILVALDIAPSVDFAPPNFNLADLPAALFKVSKPSLKSFIEFLKTKITHAVIAKLEGLLSLQINVPSSGLDIPTRRLSVGTPTLDTGIDLGVFSDVATGFFPPMAVSLDEIEGLDLDLALDFSGGPLALNARFRVDVKNVNALEALADASSALQTKLGGLSGEFESITAALGNVLGDTSELLASFAAQDKLQIEVDAKFDISCSALISESSLSEIEVSLHEFESALRLKDNVDVFDFELDNLANVTITPSIALSSSAVNRDVPFDILRESDKLQSFEYWATGEALVHAAVSGIPAQVYVALPPTDLLNISAVSFDLGVDINLDQIKPSIVNLLTRLDSLSYPTTFTDNAQFLPRLDFTCMTKAGIEYLEKRDAETILTEGSPVSGFIRAIATGCSSETLLLGGGYWPDEEKLALNAVIELSGRSSVRNAIRNLKSVLGSSLYLDGMFFDALALQDLQISGRILLNMTLEAAIGISDIRAGNYSSDSVSMSLLINRFEVESRFTGQDLALDFPMSLPTPGTGASETLLLGLTNGSFALDFSASTPLPVLIQEIFDGIDYSGTIQARLPLKAQVADLSAGVILLVDGPDLFSPNSRTILDYELDLCPLRASVTHLMNGLRVQLNQSIQSAVSQATMGLDSSVSINFDKITEPLNEYVDSVLLQFVNDTLDSIQGMGSCASRRLEEGSVGNLFLDMIRGAISSANAALNSDGIYINGTIVPVFDSATFVAGLTGNLTVTFEPSASQVIGLITEFLDGVAGANLTKVGGDGSTGVMFDTSQLLNDTVTSAGLDLQFSIDMLRVKGLMDSFQSGDTLDVALGKAMRLELSNYKAYASIAVDPINNTTVNFSGMSLGIRDSSVSMTVNVRNEGQFSATVHDFTNDAVNASGLDPIVSLPMAAEITFDRDLGPVVLSPVLRVSSDGLGDFTVDMDLDLDAFLDKSVMGENSTIDAPFGALTGVLDEVIAYGPNIFVGAESTHINDIFDIVSEVSDFATGLGDFISLVTEVRQLIPPEIRSSIRQTSSSLGCASPSKSFTNYAYNELSNRNLIDTADVTRELFDPCQFLGEIQQVLNYTSTGSEVATFSDLVTLPNSLVTTLEAYFGNETEQFTGAFLLEHFSNLSARRMIDFITTFFNSNGLPSNRRRLSASTGGKLFPANRPQSVKRGNVLRAVRDAMSPLTSITSRRLEASGGDPLLTVQVNELLQLSFDFNFGGGAKQLLFGAYFHFNSGDGVATSIEHLLTTFLNNTVGDTGADLGGFVFGDESSGGLAGDFVNALVIGCEATIDVQLGLNLNPIFDESSESNLPTPFLVVNQFNFLGDFGINEFSTTITSLAEAGSLQVSGAKVLLDLDGSIPSAQLPLALNSPSELLANLHLSAKMEVDLPVFAIMSGFGYGTTIGFVDDNLLDSTLSTITSTPDGMVRIDLVKNAATELSNIGSKLNMEEFDETLPLVKKSVNELFAGEGRTLADMFDLMDWADNLVGVASPTARRNLVQTSGDYIFLSELKSQMRTQFKHLMVPGLADKEVPVVPDVATFNVVRPSGSICSGNDKAMSVEIDDTVEDTVTITLCALIAYDVGGSFDADGLTNLLEDVPALNVEGGFSLAGSLMVGARLTASENWFGLISVSAELDPIIAQLNVLSKINATAGFGMINAAGKGTARFDGMVQLNYNSGSFTHGFTSETLFGYEIMGQVALEEPAVAGVLVDPFEFKLNDTDVFDDIAPSISYPSIKALLDSIKFSPAAALTMLRTIDGFMVEAMRNQAFEVNLPLLDTSIASILSVTKAFSDNLFEFFVTVQSFDDRAAKSLSIVQSGNTMEDVNTDLSLELYVIHTELMANPIAGNAAMLRSQAGICEFTLKSGFAAGDSKSDFLAEITSTVTCSDGLNFCPSTSCEPVYGINSDGSPDLVRFENCECDIVFGIDDNDSFFVVSVPFKDADEKDINDVKLLALFEPYSDWSADGAPREELNLFGIPVNKPVTALVVPRFDTLQDLAYRMSQALTKATGHLSTVDVSYHERSATESEAFMFSLDFGSSIEAGKAILLAPGVSIGDLASVQVLPESINLNVSGSFSFKAEAAMILEPDPIETVKIIGSLGETADDTSTCLPFDFFLAWENGDNEGNTTVSVSCTIQDPVERLQSAINNTELASKLQVVLFGESSVVIEFPDPLYFYIEMYIEEQHRAIIHSTYGFVHHDKMKKASFQFGAGLLSADASLEVEGGVGAAANIASLEVGVDLGVRLFGDVEFSAGKRGQFIGINEWLASLMNIKNSDSDYYNATYPFATAIAAFDGKFDAMVSVTNPISISHRVEGKFEEEFILDLIDLEATSESPSIILDANLPGFGDLRNLSFEDVLNALKKAMDLLVGPEEADTVESCSGGLLGTRVLGENVFTKRIPVIGVSACDMAKYLTTVVNAVDALASDTYSETSLQALEVKLETLLQDGIAGDPDVNIDTSDDDLRSVIEIEFELVWSFLEIMQLQVDLSDIFEGLSLDQVAENFAKGIVGFDGQGIIELEGSLSFNLGVGVEYDKVTRSLHPFIKGSTGLALGFSAEAALDYIASMGLFTADIGVSCAVHNHGNDILLHFGLDETKNYYLSPNNPLARNGFLVTDGISDLIDRLEVVVAGQIIGEVTANIRGLPQGATANAHVKFEVSDINNLFQNAAGAFSVVYDINFFGISLPSSFLDILLMDPQRIVDAVDSVLKVAEDLSLGRNGVVTRFQSPFIGNSIPKALKAGTQDHFLAKARRAVIGSLASVLTSSDNSTNIPAILTTQLENSLGPLGILAPNESVGVAFYTHTKDGNRTKHTGEFDPDAGYKSIMWTIPFGKTETITLPELDFQLQGDFPLNLKVDAAPPELALSWGFKMSFGFDEDDGFFIYTWPDEESEFFISADFNLPNLNLSAELLRFLKVNTTNTDIYFGAGIFVDISKEAATRKSDDAPGSIRHGRLTREMLSRMPVKRDLFQICAAAAGVLKVEEGAISLNTDNANISDWLPTLTLGDPDSGIPAIEAIARKEVTVGRTSTRRGRSLKDSDRRRLWQSTPDGAHIGQRLLCAEDLVETMNAGNLTCEFGNETEEVCVKLGKVTLDVEKIQDQVSPIISKLVNSQATGAFDEIAKPLSELEKRLPGVSDLTSKKLTLLDIAEIVVGPKSGAPTVRTILAIQRSMKEIQFNNTEDILLADECTITPTRGMVCSGGVTGGLNRRLQSGCPSSFTPPSCSGSCTACGALDKPICLANLLKCKGASILGLAFPFMDDPTSVLDLLSGGDIKIIEFHPPPVIFSFEQHMSYILYFPPVVALGLDFSATVKLEYSLVLNSKAIREAVEERNPLKALNSFAFRDTFDGVDRPLITFEAGVIPSVSASAVFVETGVGGGLTFSIEIDWYDPYPETSGGIIRPFELLALGSNPLNWFTLRWQTDLNLFIYVKVGVFITVPLYGRSHLTLYELRAAYTQVIMALYNEPQPFPPLAQKSSSGQLSLSEWDPSNNVTCANKGGSVGNEELQCWETDSSAPIIQTFSGVRSLQNGNRRRLRRDLQAEAGSGSLLMECIQSDYDHGSNPTIVLNYGPCQISNSLLIITRTSITGVGRTTFSGLTSGSVTLPSPPQDGLVTTVGNSCDAQWTLTGDTSIEIKGREVNSGCKIIATSGTRPVDLWIDFDEQKAGCTNDYSVLVQDGLVTLNNGGATEATVTFDSSVFKDINIIMSPCNDVVKIETTSSAQESISIYGGAGDDTVTLGTVPGAFDANIHANLIVYAGDGFDSVTIHDGSSEAEKTTKITPAAVQGLYADSTKSISYFGVEAMTINLGTKEADVDITSTAQGLGLTLNYSVASDIAVGSAQGPLTLNTGDGNAVIDVAKIDGPLTLICGIGDHDVKLSEIAGDVLLTLGDGNQIVGIEDITNNLAVTLGTGNHVLRISGTTGNINATSLGGGEEFIVVQNTASDVSITTTSTTTTSNYTIQDTTGNVTVNSLQSSSGQGTHYYDISNTSGDVAVTAQGGNVKVLDVKTNATQTVMNVLDTTTGDQSDSDHAFDIENTLQRDVFLTSLDSVTDIDIFNTTGNVIILAGLYQEVDAFMLETGGVSIAENDTFSIEFDQTIGELTVVQSHKPTASPSHTPSKSPSQSPSRSPTVSPTTTKAPTSSLSSAPSKSPSQSPTVSPATKAPTASPSSTPIKSPSLGPSQSPTVSTVTKAPSASPSSTPSKSPSLGPSQSPTVSPATKAPSASPSSTPSKSPSLSPSQSPTVSPATEAPSASPSSTPSKSPSLSPSKSPTDSPTKKSPSASPSSTPSNSPSLSPSKSPTDSPTKKSPSASPSSTPSKSPSLSPSKGPVEIEGEIHYDDIAMCNLDDSAELIAATEAVLEGIACDGFSNENCQAEMTSVCGVPVQEEVSMDRKLQSSSSNWAVHGYEITLNGLNSVDAQSVADILEAVEQDIESANEDGTFVQQLIAAAGAAGMSNDMTSMLLGAVVLVTNESTPSLPASRWYPAWGHTGDYCLNDGNEPLYMRLNPGQWTEPLLSSCCKRYYDWVYSDCIGTANTGSSRWFVNHQSSTCVQDCPKGSSDTCGGLAKSWIKLYDTALECCSVDLGWISEQFCVAQSTGVSTGTNLWFVNWIKEACVKDCESSAGSNCGGVVTSSATETFETADSCCENKLGWVGKDNCVARSTGATPSQQGSFFYYVDWTLMKCVKDCEDPSDPHCKGLAEKYDTLYDSANTCCSEKLFWLDPAACVP